jgi:hypothetical protein
LGEVCNGYPLLVKTHPVRGKEFDELDKAVRSGWPIGKRERVESEAYEYLTWCSHWCRARVEERARRLAAELADGLSNALLDIERELLEYAGILARLQTELLKRAKEWSQKATSTENIGELLYNPNVLRALEVKISERQGDQYDSSVVAQRALQRLGKTLRELRIDEAPKLISALIEAAREAIGDLDEGMLQDTRFAAYDLLSAQFGDNNALDQTLRRTTESGAPFVRLNPTPPGGYWVQGNDLLEIRGAGLRGGDTPPDQDQDRERVRVIESLKRIGWSHANEIQTIDDSSQIVLFQESGGFPLRALQGIEDMKREYEEHYKQGGAPLHIVRDEMVERYPDILPPRSEDLDRALTIQTVGIPLGYIAQSDFQHPDGSNRTIRLYAYLREIPELARKRPVQIGETVESVGMKLAYDPKLLSEIEQTIDTAMNTATEEQKKEFAMKLHQHLDEVKERLSKESAGADPTNMPAYQREEDRVRQFMKEYGLRVVSAESK